ncbi:MAG: M48 family metallopeptidase [Thauera sp.]
MIAGRRPTAQERAHSLVIEGTRIELVLRRSARRSFALQVDHRGARVAAPLLAPLGEIERFVFSHGRWLLDRLQARAAASVRPPVEVVDGAMLPLFGEPLVLRLHDARSTRWRMGAEGGEELVLPTAVDPLRALLRALQARALAWYRGRVEEYCHRLGLAAPAVRLSNARTRWGSCSSRSGIRLHWRLVHLPPALIDYVVAHEVAHLLEMNHSPRFWMVVERLYPDWREARAALRRASASLPVIAAAPATDTGHFDDED